DVKSGEVVAPRAGYCTIGLGCFPVFISTVPRSWLPSLVTSERTIDKCLNWLATVGRISLISTPEAGVLMGLNSPPVCSPGLRSQRSMWLGPPPIHRMMRLLASFLRVGWAACSPRQKARLGADRAEAAATCLRK